MTASDKSLEVLRNVVADALLLRRVRPAETQGFSKLKHNAHLCPGVEERLDQVLLGVSKRVAFTSDIQGFNDHGVDVLITIQVEGGRQKYIAIQIKSEDEAADRDLFRTLKAGYVDATSHYYEDKLLDYYIFLGWDARGKLDRIRNVTAELATLEKIRVIDPVRAWAFFSGTTDTDIDALVTASVTDDDPLLREARRTTASLSHSGLATLLIALATWVWEPGQSINSSSVEGSSFRDRIIDGAAIVYAYELGPVDSSIRLPPLEGGCPLTRKEQLAVDFEEIDDYLGDYDESSVTISQRTLVPVIALAYDALARYGYSSEELATYLFELLTTVRLTTEEQRELEEELAEIVGYSATPDDEQVGLLSTLIQLNCPDAVADKTQDEWENRALHLLRSFGDYADD